MKFNTSIKGSIFLITVFYSKTAVFAKNPLDMFITPFVGKVRKRKPIPEGLVNK